MAMAEHEEALEILESVVATRLAKNVRESDRKHARRDLMKCYAAVYAMRESIEISMDRKYVSLL